MKANKSAQQQRLTAKRLLFLEVLICVVAVISMLALTIFVASVPMEDWQITFLLIIGIAQLIVAMFSAIIIEQNVGFYHCAKCGNYYVPTFGKVFWAPHLGRTRYLKCPRCNQRSWQKKALDKNGH